MSQNATRKRAMLEALRATLGIISAAAEKAGIDRKTHYRWLKEDPDYAEAVANVAEYVTDFAESSLFKLIQEGNPQATLFYMKTRGRSRGYVERQEIEITEKKPLSWLEQKDEE